MREDYDHDFWAKHSVTRPNQPLALVDDFEAMIESNPSEHDVQEYLQENPWLLSEQFPHCHFILPQFSLGGQFVADFIAPERCSGETIWMLIEIERPDCKLLTRAGEFAETPRRAIGQVRDWRIWLQDNQETARKSRLRGGLGLFDISRLLSGYVVVGRRRDVSSRFNQLRSNLLEREAINVVTYDRIIEWARKRAQFWQGQVHIRPQPASKP